MLGIFGADVQPSAVRRTGRVCEPVPADKSVGYFQGSSGLSVKASGVPLLASPKTALADHSGPGFTEFSEEPFSIVPSGLAGYVWMGPGVGAVREPPLRGLNTYCFRGALGGRGAGGSASRKNWQIAR